MKTLNFTVGLLCGLCTAYAIKLRAQSYEMPYQTFIFTTCRGTNSTAWFNQPLAAAADRQGNVYVTDGQSPAIKRLTADGTNWSITIIAGLPGQAGAADGTNGDARFQRPEGIAVDNSGTIYVTDGGVANTVRRIVPVGTNWVVTTIAGTAGLTGTADGTNADARFKFPASGDYFAGLAVDGATNLYIADSFNYAIRKLSPMGTNWVVTTLAITDSTNGA